MWHDFWRPRWLLIWQIANFSPLTPRQFSPPKTPNMAQISKYEPNLTPKQFSPPKSPNIEERLWIWFKYQNFGQTWGLRHFSSQDSKYGKKPNVAKISKYGPKLNSSQDAKYLNMAQISNYARKTVFSKYPNLANLKCEEMGLWKK